MSQGGYQYVNSGGTAIGTTAVGSGFKTGTQVVNSGGTAIGTMLKGGQQIIFSGGAATSTIIGRRRQRRSQLVAF